MFSLLIIFAIKRSSAIHKFFLNSYSNTVAINYLLDYFEEGAAYSVSNLKVVNT